VNATRYTVLFVDDELDILNGIRASLWKARRRWNVVFASNAEQAKAIVDDWPPDVVVSDMRMPGVDGVALLAWIRDRYPQMIRIVLSGYADTEQCQRTLNVAHQFLVKPCSAETLIATLDGAAARIESICQEHLLRVAGRLSNLPAAPVVYSELASAFEDPRVTRKRIGQIVSADAAITVRLIQIVNSSFFRLAREVTRIDEAIGYLGQQHVQSVVLAIEVFGNNGARRNGTYDSDYLQHLALISGSLARELARRWSLDRDVCFLAGMLCDIGRLVFATECWEELEQAAQESTENGGPMSSAERRVLGVSHAVFGGHLLGVWGLPTTVVDLVASHHDPGALANAEPRSMLGAVHLAHTMAADALAEVTSVPRPAEPVDPTYLARLNEVPWLDEIREQAVAAARQAYEVE
jgi:HD-like signal output (HDOD) protein/CheY-like chemotaxis protein